jgi:hypothetical protein
MKLFTFGCSFTEGQGLNKPDEKEYAILLSEKFGIKYYNYGAAGMSNDYVYRKVFETIEKQISKEDIIIIQWTHYIRKELKFKYNDKNYYHILPYGYYPFRDKIHIKKYDGIKSEYTDYDDTSIDFGLEQKKIEKINKNFIDEYNSKILDEHYQFETTLNYIKGLYSYLELNGYKHLHFFGWDDCIISTNYDKILKESFGGYTNTEGSQHPNQNQHIIWADYLCKELIKLNYI